jgi:hypothetical protein
VALCLNPDSRLKKHNNRLSIRTGLEPYDVRPPLGRETWKTGTGYARVGGLRYSRASPEWTAC